MKVIFSLAVLSFTLQIACYGKEPTKNGIGFSIKGELKGLPNGKRVYLIGAPEGDTLSFALVKNGKFYFKGVLDNSPSYCYMRVDSSLNKPRSVEFILVNSSQSISGDFSNWPVIDLSGSRPDDDYRESKALWSSFERRISQLKNEVLTNLTKAGVMRRVKDTILIPEIELRNEKLQSEIEGLLKERLAAIKQFVLERPQSLYTPELVRRLSKSFTVAEIELMYSNLTSDVKETHFAALLEDEVKISKKRMLIKPGTRIPDFLLHTLDNRKVSIYELAKGNSYTLIDFWASWCKPCREETPRLKKAYSLFKDRGFGIVGVALSDTDSSWRKAIFVDSTTWKHGRDSGNESYRIFDIPAIPGFALIDSNGKLISFSCSGSAIDAFGPGLREESLFYTLDSLLPRKVSSSDTITALKIGDKVPDVSIGRIVGDKDDKTLKISDFKGKLLILDFWSTYCTVCIAQFPKIYELQKEFGDKIAIVPIGFQRKNNAEVEVFLQKAVGTKRELKLTSTVQAVGEHKLENMFPFHGLPFEVWIDASGTLVGLTDHRAVTAENIRQIIYGSSPSFSVVKKRRASVSDFLFLNSKAGELTGCVFTGSIDTLTTISTSEILLSRDSTFWYYRGYNNIVPTYYEIAYKDFFKQFSEDAQYRILIDSQGMAFYENWDVVAKLDNWQYEEFVKKNLFSFELRVPLSFGLKFSQEYMKNALDQFLHIKSGIRKQKVKCYMLVRKPGPDLLQNNKYRIVEKYDGGRSNLVYYVQIDGDHGIPFLKRELAELLGFQNNRLIVDKTGYKKNIHITLDKRDQSMDSLRKQLSVYGLDLVEGEEEMEVLVLKRLK